MDRIDLGTAADFSLGDTGVHPSAREVVRGDVRLTTEPRVMQALIAFAEAEGRVVPRDELIARCWEGRAVSEDAINRVVAKLRKLGSDLDDAFVIETIPKTGHRLRRPSILTPRPASKRSSKLVRLAPAGLLAVILIAVVGWGSMSIRSSGSPPAGA